MEERINELEDRITEIIMSRNRKKKKKILTYQQHTNICIMGPQKKKSIRKELTLYLK